MTKSTLRIVLFCIILKYVGGGGGDRGKFCSPERKLDLFFFRKGNTKVYEIKTELWDC